MKLALGVMYASAVLATVAWPAAARQSARVPLNVTFRATWDPAKTCPPGVPAMDGGSLTPCYLVRAHGTFPGLGKVTVRESVGFLDALTNCITVKSRIVLAVGRKGEVQADGKTRRCVDPHGDVTVVPFKIIGGTGVFSGATGSGAITVTDARETGRGNGDQKETWKGTLTFSN
jgi:hypothetical protein